MKQKCGINWFALIALTCILPAVASADTDVYGKLLLATERVDDETDANSYWDVRSYASRFGIKGESATDNDALKVIYQLEWQIDVADEFESSSNHVTSRDQFLGLEGNFGQLIVGRSDTPFKSSQGALDLFNIYFDLKLLMAGGESRQNNILQYSSPKLANNTVAKVMLRPGEEPDGENNGIADGISSSVTYDSDDLHLSLAYDSGIDGEGVKAVRATAIREMGNFWVGGLLQTTDWNTGDNENVVLLNTCYQINEIRYKAQAGHTDNYHGVAENFAGQDNTADYIALGVDYSLSKKTTLGAYLGHLEGGDDLQVDPVIGGPYSHDVIGVILIHSF
ncbi:MAG: porin [Gammaproteobacteria bacterium]|nr:porin [Gammaproteobacteria bacterium]